MQHEENQATEAEAAYRRGWQQGFTEAERLILQLVELGYDRRKINQLLAIYNDHFISQWRTGDLEQKEPYPSFAIAQIEAIAATHHGYDWILEVP